jgi:hypothetical protein
MVAAPHVDIALRPQAVSQPDLIGGAILGGAGQAVGRFAQGLRPLHIGIAQSPGQVVQEVYLFPYLSLRISLEG